METVTDTTAIIGVKGSRTYYFAVTAYNTNGVESGSPKKFIGRKTSSSIVWHV